MVVLHCTLLLPMGPILSLEIYYREKLTQTEGYVICDNFVTSELIPLPLFYYTFFKIVQGTASALNITLRCTILCSLVNIYMLFKVITVHLHLIACASCSYCLPQDAAGDTPLHDAIQVKNDSGVAFLVADSRTDLTLQNRKGHTPLTLAAMKDDEM